MGIDIKGTVRLYDDDPHKGACLALWSDDLAEIERFKGLCQINLPKGLGTFHQCNSRTYQMFEFWKPLNPTMKEIGEAIAREMELDFVVNLSKSYENEKRQITLGEFHSFDPDGHIWDDFFG